MDELLFSNDDNADDVRRKIAERVASVPLRKVIKFFDTSYYNTGSIIEFLYVSCVSKTNGILHGPGGFGKSELTEEFFNYYNIPVSTVVGYHDMDVEGLLGVPNMKKLMEDSEYKTAFEKSVFNKPGILLLEEFLDVRTSTAAALKDILTKDGLRQGDTFTPSLAGQVFICSNKDPEEVSVDFSTSAFYKERFPVNLFVAWDSYATEDFNRLFKLVCKDEYEPNKDELLVLSSICSASCKDDGVISPRTAISAARVLISAGFNAIKFISELDTSSLEDIQRDLIRKKNFDELVTMIKHINHVSGVAINSKYPTLEHRISLRAKLKKIHKQFCKIILLDNMIEVVKPFLEGLESKIEQLDSLIFIIKDDNNELDYAEICKLTNKLS